MTAIRKKSLDTLPKGNLIALSSKISLSFFKTFETSFLTLVMWSLGLKHFASLRIIKLWKNVKLLYFIPDPQCSAIESSAVV